MMRLAVFTVMGALVAAPALAADYRQRAPEDEVVYFLLPDRFANGDPTNDTGGLSGGKLQTGFDPADKAFYHGGDLKGVLERLDYIQGLGATAIWLAPVFKNKPVQGEPGHQSAGYHGYWVTDFTDVDPHFGTKADLKRLVEAAHARGMKVYLDIIANHTADVIRYRECPKNDCAYRSVADYPYTRRGGISGPPINEGFQGDDAAHQTAANFAHLTRPDYAYTPYVPAGEEHAKAPEWLNDPIYYHNRGNTYWAGESAQVGDFAGLDDLFTENPRVVQGFIDIYGRWIDEFGIDGYRIDTAKHVNPEFWQAFVPAMLARAKAAGIPNFHIFGEVFGPDLVELSRATRVAGLPAVLDFATEAAVTDMLAHDAGTDRLAQVVAADPLFARGAAGARQLPTFVSNHDIGRFAHVVRQAKPGISGEEMTQRVILAHALLMFGRGVPVIYAGDEQGFVGMGGDQDARQDLGPTQVAAFAADRLASGEPAGPGAHFDTGAPIYRALADMAKLRSADPALRRGDIVVRAASAKPGLFAFSRHLPGGPETLVAVNTSTAAIQANVRVDAVSASWTSLHGACGPAAGAPGSYAVRLAPLSYIVCAAGGAPGARQ